MAREHEHGIMESLKERFGGGEHKTEHKPATTERKTEHKTAATEHKTERAAAKTEHHAAKEAHAAVKQDAKHEDDVAKHVSGETHRYVVHFPPHPARTEDPHYKDFDAYHRKTRATARCYIGERVGFHDCRDEKGKPTPPPAGGGEQEGLELHHSHVEFSLQHGVSLQALEKDYPGINNKNEVGDWIESDANFRWLCVFHHRGPGGAHTASHSDWEAQQYVLGLISSEPKSAK
ncbi:MAG: hypothetical protein FWE35_02460 [Streptosporangiales bacterium]|jgi:hypothetical protein|nr:hypothetical protein [Streptosporangiales bacterium]